MAKAKLHEWVEKLREYVEKTGRDYYTLVELMSEFGVSSNYMREIVRVYVHKYGGSYSGGILFIEKRAREAV